MIGRALGRRKPVLLAAGVLVLVALPVLWRKFEISKLMHIGAGYAAQQTCACLWVGGRTEQSCMTDLEPPARRFVSLRVGADEVTASMLGLSSATSRYEKGFGCSLRD